MAVELWTEKYRPKTVDGYVFRDKNQQKQVDNWIKEKTIPHLLLSGGPGIGKTTLAKILLNQIGIESYDILEINASRDNGVDYLKEKVVSFVSMIPFGPFKVVLLDEADFLSINAQAILRGIMEEFHNTARFILTCNQPQRIMPAIHSRCQTFHVLKVDQDEYTARVATILIEENIEFDLDTLDTFVKAAYPDLRKCINTVQQNSRDGVLHSGNNDDSDSSDYKVKMVELFKEGNYTEARKLVCANAREEDFGEILTWLYHNLDLIGQDDDTKDRALLIIKQGMIDHTLIINPEVNFAAVMSKLSRL